MKNYYLILFVITSILMGCKESDKIDFAHPLQELATDNNGVLTWVDIEGMKCRDASDTGVGIKIQNPKKLMIYINGGGACFNGPTCGPNPSSFNEGDLFDLIAENGEPGIFNPNDERNPVKDWSVIFIPYCTGDVHSGTRHNGRALGVPGQQKYVGALNFKKVMEYVAPYFNNEGVEEILLFGLSAGGYGVYVNFLEVNKAFPHSKINIINDSGPLFSNQEAFPPCLQLAFTAIFGLPIPADLGQCCQPNLGLANVYEYAVQNFPDINAGFISSYEDRVIRFFLSFGLNNCQGAENNIMPADLFRQSIVDLRDDELTPNNWPTFLINGDTHTLLASNEIYYERQVEGIYLYEWVDRLIKGKGVSVSE